MTTHSLVLTFVVGAALLAAWIDHTWAGRMPRTVGRALVHVTGGLLALGLAPSLMAGLSPQDSPTRAMAALLALFLPALVYCFMSWIWVIRLVQSFQRFG